MHDFAQNNHFKCLEFAYLLKEKPAIINKFIFVAWKREINYHREKMLMENNLIKEIFNNICSAGVSSSKALISNPSSKFEESDELKMENQVKVLL